MLTFYILQMAVLVAGILVGVVPNSLQDIGRASDGAKRRPVEAEGWAGGCGGGGAPAVRYIYPCYGFMET
jgi:hypothetical protein